MTLPGVTRADGTPRQITTPVALGVLSFASLCVVLVSALVYRGLDPSAVIQFIGGLVPTTVGVIILASQGRSTKASIDKAADVAADNNAKLENVQTQVNGKLDTKFDDVSTTIREVVADIHTDLIDIHKRLNAAGIPKTVDTPDV